MPQLLICSHLRCCGSCLQYEEQTEVASMHHSMPHQCSLPSHQVSKIAPWDLPCLRWDFSEHFVLWWFNFAPFCSGFFLWFWCFFTPFFSFSLGWMCSRGYSRSIPVIACVLSLLLLCVSRATKEKARVCWTLPVILACGCCALSERFGLARPRIPAPPKVVQGRLRLRLLETAARLARPRPATGMTQMPHGHWKMTFTFFLALRLQAVIANSNAFGCPSLGVGGGHVAPVTIGGSINPSQRKCN